jgi:hypothetical protein
MPHGFAGMHIAFDTKSGNEPDGSAQLFGKPVLIVARDGNHLCSHPSALLGFAPEQFGHRVKFGEVAAVTEGVGAIEAQSATLGEEAPAQRLLQQCETHQGLFERVFGPMRPTLGPAAFDLPDPFEHHGVVGPVRAAMQRQADPRGRRIGAWQQQAIAAKIIEAETVASEPIEQGTEPARGKQLARQQVMALHPGLVAGIARAVDGAKR